MKNFRQVVLLSLVSVFLLACTSTTTSTQNPAFFVGSATLDRIRLQTAGFISGYVQPDQVTISGVEKSGPTELKWKADAPTGSYECISDEMVRRVFCGRRS